MTPEEKRAKLRRLQKAEKLRQLQAGQATASPEPEKEELQDSSWRDKARAVQRGQLMGWGDEATAGLAALGAKAMTLLPGKQAGEDVPLGDIYRDIVGEERRAYDAYAKDHGAEALLLEFAGGIASPGRSIGRLPKKAPKMQRFRRETARNVAEGAIGGAGVSDEDRTRGAVVGGGLGGALGTALSGAGAIPRVIANRNVKTKLNGRPLHMVVPSDATGAEAGLRTFYRQGVGGAYGGRQPLLDQERPIREAAQSALERAKGVADETDVDVKLARDLELDNLAVEHGRKGREISRTFQDKIDEVTASANAKAESIKAKPQAVRTAEANQLQRQAKDAAMPDRMPAKQQAALRNAEPEEAVAMLNNWWRGNGFQSVKANRFDWDDGELISTLKNVLDEDPGLKLAVGQAPGMTRGMVKKLLKLKKGEVPESISGEQLMAIRNVFAMASNNTSKKFDKAALRRVANEFDRFIRKRLDGDDLAAFNDDMAKYGPTRLLQDATIRAAKKNGAFDAEDWLAVLPKTEVSEGKGMLQAAARAARSRIKVADQEAANILKRGGELPSETQRLKRTLQRQRGETLAAQAARTKGLQRDVRLGARNDAGLARARAMRDEAKGTLDEIKARSLPDTSGPSQLVMTGAFGAPLAGIGAAAGGPTGMAMGLAAGRQVAQGLARPGVQRALAGQTRPQRQLNYALNQARKPRYGGDSMADIINRMRRSAQGAALRDLQDK